MFLSLTTSVVAYRMLAEARHVRTSFSIAFSSCAVAKLCSCSRILTCSMGSRAVRIALMSSRVRYVVPGSLIECP